MSTNADRYRSLRSLFERAVDLEGDERRAFLDASCPDPALRSELERLLDADHRASGAFGTQANGVAAPAFLERVPERIGRYRVTGRLGSGGMGTVFAAEQDTPRRSVALKVLNVGMMTPALQRRFEHEGEILARLAHPGIAHVYESGTAEIWGVTLPYFAMELVQGVPITQFVDERHLGWLERLQLVARVADAVEHAHRSGVIHRDLKPENILVGADGNPRVLDFGVARVTEGDERSRTLRTQSGMLIGTLAYMSPEQVSGDPDALDTRSDVYALGVLAYELVTGRLPHDVSRISIVRAARIITEVEPERPSAIDRRLRGDVETVLLKALEKDKARRYASAAAFATDLRAILEHKPVAARPATTIYQVRKFARRHPGLVIGLSTTFAALVAGLVVSLVYYARSERAHKRSSSINEFVLKEMFAAPDPWSPQGKDVTIASVLDRISNRVVTSFRDDPELEADAQATLGGSYLARGMLDRGATHAARALELRRELHGGDDIDVAESLLLRARVNVEQGALDAAAADAREAIAMFERLSDAPQEKLADAKRTLARAQLSQGEHADALKGYQTVLDMRRAAHGPVHEAVCAAQADVLAARLAMGDLDEAARLAREVLALRRTLHGDDGVYVALSMTDLASVLYERNDPASLTECVDLYRQAAAIAQRRLGGEHRLTLVTRRSLANALVRAGHGEEAEQILREVTAKLPSVIGETHEDYLHTLNSYGYLLFQLERPDEAVVQYHKALEISEKVFGPEHDNTLRPLSNLAAIEKDRGLASASDADGDGKIDVVAGTDLSRAIEHYQRVLAGFEKLYGPKHHHTASTAYALGDLYDKIGRDREAADLLGRNAEALALNKPLEWDQTITRVLLRQGLALMRLGAASEAEPVLRRSVEQCRAVFPAGDWRTALCASALGACLKETGQLTEAETLLTESLAALEPQRAKRKKDYAAAKERLVSVYEAQGRPEQAAALRARE